MPVPEVLRAALLPLLFVSSVSAADVRVLFDPTSPATGPFPTNALTVPDAAQKTGLRMNLPSPDCVAEPSTCEEIAKVNLLDGFNIEPRVRVRFSGPVDVNTLRAGIFILWLDDVTGEGTTLRPFGHLTPMNAVAFDPATNTAYAEPEEVLAQHRRYALLVTNAVRGPNGAPVVPDPAFLACMGRQTGYCEQLAQAIRHTAMRYTSPRVVVGGSVFTTMSVTVWLERARQAIQSSPVAFQRTQPQNVFSLAELSSIVYRTHVGVDPATFTSSTFTVHPRFDGVGKLAFGTIQSPSFVNEHQVIPTVPTGAEVPLPETSKEITLYLFLPDAPAPEAGYPVVVVGHGGGGNGLQTAAALAPAMAAEGIAVVSLNNVSHGGGPLSKIVLTNLAGASVEIPAGGRGSDINDDGRYMGPEGCFLYIPPDPVGFRDCARQTALDMMQLVRAIRAGLDVDGDGVADLDRERVYYAGGSQGAVVGTVLMAVEPGIQVAAITSGPGSAADAGRVAEEGAAWNSSGNLQSLRTPPLFNVGVDDYDCDWPLRNKPVRIISVPGALALQEYLERMEWIWMTGDPLGFAAHLRSSPLAGVPEKRILFQFGIGDIQFPNPAQSNLVRAANLRETTSIYRHDLARATPGIGPLLPRDPHGIFYQYNPSVPAIAAISRAAQRQIVEFFLSGTEAVPDVNSIVRLLFGIDLFEVPAVLPEETNFQP